MSDQLEKAAKIQWVASLQLKESFNGIGTIVNSLSRAIFHSTLVINKQFYLLGGTIAAVAGKYDQFKNVIQLSANETVKYARLRASVAKEFNQALGGIKTPKALSKLEIVSNSIVNTFLKVKGAFKGTFKTLDSALGKTGNTFGKIGGALVKVGSAVKKGWQTPKKASRAFGAIKSRITDIRTSRRISKASGGSLNSMIGSTSSIMNPFAGIRKSMSGIGAIGVNIAKVPFKAVAAPFKAIGKAGAKTFKAMGNGVKQMGQMGPQMAMMAIVMEPLMAMLSAFLEPFDVLTVYFESFGTILGQLLVPVIEALIPILDQMIPVFEQLVTALMPAVVAAIEAVPWDMIIEAGIQLLPIILTLVNAFTRVMIAIAPLNNLIMSGLMVGVNGLFLAMQPVVVLVDGLSRAVEKFMGWLNKLVGGFETVTSGVEDFFNTLSLDFGNKSSGGSGGDDSEWYKFW